MCLISRLQGKDVLVSLTFGTSHIVQLLINVGWTDGQMDIHSHVPTEVSSYIMTFVPLDFSGVGMFSFII